jgi:hypothetical protein
MVNRGQSCTFVNFGVPAQRGNPAESGSITKAPTHGKAVFAAPSAVYTPAPGFAGIDTFEYEARAFSQSGRPLLLRVRVSMVVEAP